MVTNILCYREILKIWSFLGLWFPWMRLYHLETLTSLPCPAGTVWSASGSPRRSWLPWQHSPRKHLSPCRPAAWAGFATQCWHCNLLKEQRQKRLLSHVEHIEYFLFQFKWFTRWFPPKLQNVLTSENSEGEHHKDLHDWHCSWKETCRISSLWLFFIYISQPEMWHPLPGVLPVWTSLLFGQWAVEHSVCVLHSSWLSIYRQLSSMEETQE